MSFKELVEQKKKIQNAFLEFLEDESNVEENYENFIKIIKDQKIVEDKYEFKSVIQMISNICDYHQRFSNFIDKIEQILTFFKKDIQKYFSNSEIFDFFALNKRILLFFIEEKMIVIDENIYSKLTDDFSKKMKYVEYFKPEINQYLGNTEDHEFKEDFFLKRKIGENDNLLCEMIRLKKTREFISHVNKNLLPLDIYIEESIFETNPFLIFEERLVKSKDPILYPHKVIKKINLIEYASFFGANEIIKYMQMEIIKSMWLYAIHSKNTELIKYIEDNLDDNYLNDIEKVRFHEFILEESIKCHHNDISNYIINNIINEEDLNDRIEKKIL